LLLLACGEFGDRLVRIAGRHGLDFKLFKKEWGEVFTRKEIAGFLDNELPDYSWLWTADYCTSKRITDAKEIYKNPRLTP